MLLSYSTKLRKLVLVRSPSLCGGVLRHVNITGPLRRLQSSDVLRAICKQRSRPTMAGRISAAGRQNKILGSMRFTSLRRCPTRAYDFFCLDPACSTSSPLRIPSSAAREPGLAAVQSLQPLSRQWPGAATGPAGSRRHRRHHLAHIERAQS